MSQGGRAWRPDLAAMQVISTRHPLAEPVSGHSSLQGRWEKVGQWETTCPATMEEGGPGFCCRGSLCPSKTQKEEIWESSRAELCTFPLAPIRSCRQGGRQDSSQVDGVQLKHLHQWSPTRVLILFVCTCFLTGVYFCFFWIEPWLHIPSFKYLAACPCL